MTLLYGSGSSTSSWVKNTKSLWSMEFALWNEVAKICNGSKAVSNLLSWLIEVRSAKILYSSSQFLSCSLANSIISISVLSSSDGNMGLALTFGVSIIVCLARLCFDLPISSIGFWRLIKGGVDFQACFLILILSSKVADLNKEGSCLASDGWIPSNIGFLLNSGRAECVFTTMSSKICKSLTLMTLFCFLT